MTNSMKFILFVFLPVFCLVFFQMERGRMENAHHKTGYFEQHSDVSTDADDDDSISMLAEDDDGDDATESISKIAPSANSIAISCVNYLYESPVTKSLSRQISYRDVSPSFLRVFRI